MVSCRLCVKAISCLEVLPNHDKKSAIVTYMETTVRKAMELDKSVPADIAEKLLSKAEGFVRSKPQIPRHGSIF